MVNLYKMAVRLLGSLGVTLLVLSLTLVPTSALLADIGLGGITVPDRQCLDNNGCNSGGCLYDMPNNRCPIFADATNCQWTVNGCFGCSCTGCYFANGILCGCKCRLANPGCDRITQTCN
jgi:hypothetical protein